MALRRVRMEEEEASLLCKEWALWLNVVNKAEKSPSKERDRLFLRLKDLAVFKDESIEVGGVRRGRSCEVKRR